VERRSRWSRLAVVRSFALAALIAEPAAAAPSGRATTPERDMLRTELVIRPTDQGLRLERVQLDEPLREFRFFSPSEPRRVLVDPRRWLLAKITPE
jgi:hypothetical protein